VTESLSAALKIVFRNRQNVFWGFAFPLFFVLAFSFFKGGGELLVRTEILAPESGPAADVANFLETTLSESLAFRVSRIEIADTQAVLESDLRSKVEHGTVDAVVALRDAPGGPLPKVYLSVIYNEGDVRKNGVILSTISSFVDKTNLRAAGIAEGFAQASFSPVSTKKVNFFDFTLAGFIAYGVASISVIGIASAMVGYRKSQIFKRLACTPVKPTRFVLAHVAARLLLSVIQVIVIVAVAKLLGAHVYGNPAWAVALIVFGNVIFLNLGLALSGVIRGGPEVASAAGTAITFPMFILSGSFFSLDNLPWVIRAMAEVLPLTPLVSGTRKILLEGASFVSLGPQILLLGAWVVGSSILAVFGFKKLLGHE